MRIGIVTGIFPPDPGGPASYVPRVSAALAARDHDVRVLCLSDRLDHDDSCYTFPVKRVRRGTLKPLRWLKTILALRSLAKQSDVLYVNGLGFEAMLASLLTATPTVHKIVGDYAWERARNRGWFQGTIDEYQAARKTPLLRLLDWIRTVPLRSARRIITPSHYLEEMVSGWGVPSQRIDVVYNAIEPVAPAPEAKLVPFDGHTVVTVCRLVPWKGVDGIIEAVAGIADCRLIVVGDGPERSRYEACAADVGVADRVLFLATVPPGHVAAYLLQADVFVLNSTYEGLPHVVLEAMAAGVPVVATAVGGTPEAVQHRVTGLLVAPRDTDALRGAISRLLENREFRSRLAHEARQRLESEFAFDTMVQQTERILLGEAAGPEPSRAA